ncbi:abortive infection family protein [Belnapia rosea]|uniref:Abortive infection C-terminus n=1 Tax=Belnapia rosea TaxID=938405 RepID=A0A1G6SX87_9PROT|nr:abortive infection family protein [Belnapia rosea]SDD21438.1 Abortive infection C-terminus [Belnapia rosea]
MNAKVPPGLIRELRDQLASAISDAKAYEVPSLCARLGLAEGTEEEAYRSKYKYAKSRLAGIATQRILLAAEEYLTEEPNFSLSEIVAKIGELNGPELTDLTRKRILNLFNQEPLVTEVDEIDFLRQLWPIASMRCVTDDEQHNRSLEEAVIQHTIRNYDWDNGDLLKATGLPNMSRSQFFRFLGAVVDPLAQTQQRQEELVPAINAHLKHDGYALKEITRISGSPRYEVKRILQGSPADEGISATLVQFSPDDVHVRWLSALERRTSDPPGAITLARTLLEDVCKWILTEVEDKTWKDSDDLPVLYRKLAKHLNLAPDNHTEEIFKSILGNCQSVVTSIGALRNKLGDAHSPGPRRARPLPRHAELTVNLSGTMATFLVSTWKARILSTRTKKEEPQ